MTQTTQVLVQLSHRLVPTSTTRKERQFYMATGDAPRKVAQSSPMHILVVAAASNLLQ
jgi:hypothetical protein